MSECKVMRQCGYTVMSNYHLRDKRLSLKAKGLLSVILGLPEDWDYTIKGLCTICDTGREAMRAALLELEGAGYLTRSRQRSEDGTLAGTQYIIRETPEQEAQPDEDACASPKSENPMLDKPTLENQPQLNTKGNQVKNKKTERAKKGNSHLLDDGQLDQLVMQNVGTLGNGNGWSKDEMHSVYLLCKEFYGDRECSGKPPAHTARGVGGLFRKLAPGGRCTFAEASDMLLTAIERGWTSVYPKDSRIPAAPVPQRKADLGEEWA